MPGLFPGGKGSRCVGLTTLPPSCVDCVEIWEPQPPGTLLASNRPVPELLYHLFYSLKSNLLHSPVCFSAAFDVYAWSATGSLRPFALAAYRDISKPRPDSSPWTVNIGTRDVTLVTRFCVTAS